MKLHELIEAIDVSELAVTIYKQLPEQLDQTARKEAKQWLRRGEEANPSDPIQGAYDEVEKEYKRLGLFHPGYLLKNRATDHLKSILMEYLERHIKDGRKITIDVTKGTKTGVDPKTGKPRKTKLRTGQTGTQRHQADFGIEFNTDLGGDLGQYNLGRARVQVPNEKWLELWGEFFGEYASGNDTEWVFDKFVEKIMSTTVHELTHLVNDVIATSHSSAAFLKKGKAYHEDDAKDFADKIYREIGSNIFHLSRHSEIQAFASEIAWEMMEDMFRGSYSYHTVDDAIEALKQGYYSDTMWRNYYDVDTARRYYKDQPGKLKQLERLWKTLLKAVIDNLQHYRKYESPQGE